MSVTGAAILGGLKTAGGIAAPVLGAATGGAAQYLVRMAPYIAAGLSESGKALREDEKLQAQKLRERSFGPSEVVQQARLRRQTRQLEQALAPAVEGAERTARAQGPFGGGQLTEQTGQIAESVATGQSQIGAELQAMSSKEAKDEERQARSAVQNAWLRRVGMIQDIIGGQGPGAGMIRGLGIAEEIASGGESLGAAQ